MRDTAVRLDRAQLAGAIKHKARELGFDLVGIAPAEPSRYRGYFRQWLDDGKAGAMDYLAKRFEERVDPGTYLPAARSVVCVALNYHTPLEPVDSSVRARQAKIARYALGDDYHELIKHRLYDLADWIREQAPEALTRCGVDTVPVMEKELAARAGIGWMGKNTCIINERIGSWLLLGEVLTTLDLPSDAPTTDHCGSCTRCIDACPTDAITDAYQLDATRCISYLTIELRDGAIPREFHDAMGPWMYGCDICQDVCPFNGRALNITDPALHPRFASGGIDANEVLNWTPQDYLDTLRGSAMKRIKLPILQRNATIVADNLMQMDARKDTAE